MTQDEMDTLYKLHKVLEGYEPKAYRDSGGVLTIGVGHANQDTEPFVEGDTWTAEKIHDVWLKDVELAENQVLEWAPIVNDIPDFKMAMVDLVFNTGRKPASMIKYLNQHKLVLAQKEFLRWVYVNGVVQLGLVKRRFADLLISNGEDPFKVINVPLKRGYLDHFNRFIEPYGYQIHPVSERRKYVIEEL